MFIPIKTSNYNGLTTWTTHGHSKLMFIIISAVIKVLKATPFSSIGYDTFITTGCHNGILGVGKGIWRTWMSADLALKYK